MEYVPGRTLRDLLNSRGRLGPHEALDVMAGVLGGLAAAHDAGIAHRDVKPEKRAAERLRRESRSPTSGWPGCWRR
jgi:tRNA A-37 threonylcarbamoyl transferase component Bud32